MSFETDTLTYKAVTYFDGSDPLTLTDKTIKLEKKPNGKYGINSKKILVKVNYAALNPVDLVIYRSSPKLLSRFIGEQGIGRDYSGTIVDIGDEAAEKTSFKINDQISGMYPRFFGPGTVAEYVILDPFDEKDVESALIPKNLSLSEASAFPLVLGTALDVFDKASELNSNSKVLIIGAGTSVGRYLVQLAKNYYNVKEVVTTNSPKSDDDIKSFGADKIIDYTKHKSILNPVLESVKETGKFDAILDSAGSSDLFPQINEILKHKNEGGSYVTVVGDKKYDYTTANLFGLFLPNIKAIYRTFAELFGLTTYSYKFSFVSPGTKWIDHAKDLIEKGTLKVNVDSIYKLSNFQDAFEKLSTNKAQGKVLIELSE